MLNLKNFSRLDQAKVDNISLNDCFESTLVIAKNTIKHKVKVIKQYGDIPKIPCSPSQINQVFSSFDQCRPSYAHTRQHIAQNLC